MKKQSNQTNPLLQDKVPVKKSTKPTTKAPSKKPVQAVKDGTTLLSVRTAKKGLITEVSIPTPMLAHSLVHALVETLKTIMMKLDVVDEAGKKPAKSKAKKA